MIRRRRLQLGGVIVSIAATLAIVLPAGALADVTELVPGTGVLLSQSSSSSGSGATSSTTSRTHIFSPAAYADYKRFGGEPTVTVDRYPFAPGTFDCPATATSPCPPKDTVYVSGPNGFAYPHYSPFFKSSDLGQTFRVPQHVPAQGQTFGTGGGGGDSHSAVGSVTHRVFFVDLPGVPGCVTMNTSDDLGESWLGDNLGCGPNPGALDDRQWVDADETFPGSKNVYVSFINFTNAAAPTLSLALSTHDGNLGTFVTDSDCNTADGSVPSVLAACPDPADPNLQIAGPVVADKEGTPTRPPSHDVYIPFVRSPPIIPGVSAGPPYSLWIAKSVDGGATWTQLHVADLGDHNPINLFPQLTIDRGGNLYYTWSQTQGPGSDSSGLLGEQDVHYTYSTDHGVTWAPPIDLTQSTGKTAVMPWMVAGDPGQVDLVYYQANTGLNSNTEFTDTAGALCSDSGVHPGCPVWNVYFGHSNNALNGGSNFSNTQISDHPNHIGQVCTAGLACSGDRDLLDFFTVDLDHLGAANVVWADDNTSRGSDTRNKFSRQLSGPSVYKNQNIGLQNSWPIRDHAVIGEPAGDAFNTAGSPNGSCPGMDLLAMSASRSSTTVTISLTLNSAPTSAKAVACSTAGPPTPPPLAATGGLWGAEFWASADGGPENFYIAYRDNPPDGAPRVEAGRMANVNVLITSLEFQPDSTVPGTFGGTCFPATGPPATGTCTITMTVDASKLGLKSGAGMYSISGLSTYQSGTSTTPPLLRLEFGNSEQADATVALDYNGTGTTG